MGEQLITSRTRIEYPRKDPTEKRLLPPPSQGSSWHPGWRRYSCGPLAGRDVR